MRFSSSKCITPIYLVYQASDAEEHTADFVERNNITRKRGDSEMMDDHDVDDFILRDKRQKLHNFIKNQESETQFNYGSSPGFHI